MKLDKIIFATILALYSLVFADTIHMKNGDKIENATLTEITQTDIKYKVAGRAVVYTISKDDAIKIVYSDGSEDVFSEEKDSVNEHIRLYDIGARGNGGIDASVSFKSFQYFDSENNFVSYYGPGFGLYFNKGDYSLPIFYNLNLGLQKGYFEYFFNNRFGTNIIGNYKDESCFLCDIFYEPSLGIQYNNFNLFLGYNFSKGFESSFAIRAGYMHHYEKKVKDDSGDIPKEKSQRYFRPGIEYSLQIWRSEIYFFDDSSPYSSGRIGLFFRIGPEDAYLTTGIYLKGDDLEKEISQDLNLLGINLINLPSLNLIWSLEFIEIPLLISFGSGQIKFTGGALFDFYLSSELDIHVGGTNILSTNDKEEIENLFGKAPNSMYWVLGLDFDIFRHWGIGVKFLILNHSWSDSDIPLVFEPSRFQTGVSTYFVF